MFLGFRLTLRRRRDGRLTLTIPLAWRLLLAAIAGFVIFALFATMRAAEVFSARNIAPLLFALFALLGASYDEQWVFDRRQDLLLRRLGLWPLAWSRRMRISQLKQVGLEQLIRGRQQDSAPRGRRRALTILLLIDSEGRVYRLEQFSASLLGKARQQALAIASYCNIPFRDEAADQ
jgi:hypothetical protein